MGRLKTEHCSIDSRTAHGLDFKYDVSVNQEGLFTTTLPEKIATMISDVGIHMAANRLKSEGYFEAKSLEELKAQVNAVGHEYLSRECTSEKIVIRYTIATACSYLINDEGEIVPNGNYVNDYATNPDRQWRGGTIETNENNHHAYGIQVYAKPFIRKDYLFKSGKTLTEYEMWAENRLSDITGELFEHCQNLKWLRDTVGMATPGASGWRNDHDRADHEIDYTSEVALFFVNLIKSICLLNEQIKDKLNPESIKIMAHRGVALLGPATQKEAD